MLAPTAPTAAHDTDTAARAMKVHRRQALLLSTLIQNAAPTDLSGESAAKWNDALNSLHDRLLEWSQLSLVDAYFASDNILQGILYLYQNDFRWCGLLSEEASLQFLEQRRRDHADLLETLRQIASSPDLLDQVLLHPPIAIAHFIQALQTAVERDNHQATTLAKLHAALKYLYRSARTDIPTPNLTSQISSVEIVSDLSYSNPCLTICEGNWQDHDTVIVKAVRNLRSDDNAVVKRFVEETSSFFNIRHPNIIRVLGTMIDSFYGCCLIYPPSRAAKILTHLQFVPNANVLPLLDDVVSGVQFLHSRDPPILHGDLRTENVLVMDDGNACLTDYGIMPLVGGYGEALAYFLRWMAPELIRAELKRQESPNIKPAYTRCTDVYALGCMFFGDSEPFNHVRQDESLENEILHGLRPTLSNEAKIIALSRGWTNGLQKLLTACLDGDPRQRPTTDKVKEVLIAEMISRTTLTNLRAPGSPESVYTQRSGSGSSSSSSGSSRAAPSVRSSWRASSALNSFPPTPRLSSMATPVIASGSGSWHNSHDPIFPNERRVLYNEPVEEDDAVVSSGVCADDLIPAMQRRNSNFPEQFENNTSEHTIRPDPHSSFSDDDSDDSGRDHVGQTRRHSTAYARMPKLQAPSLSSSRRRVGNERFRILVDRMTEAGRLHESWVGVAPMEQLRALAPKQVRQIRGIEELVRHESAFLAGGAVADFVARRLRADPDILGKDRLETFLSSVTEDNRLLRQFNQQFHDALQAHLNVTMSGFQQVAQLCKEAGEQFATVYSVYVRHLPEFESILENEISTNERFAALMKEPMPGGQNVGQALREFLVAPVKHLDKHPHYLRFIISKMPENDRDTSLLREALAEMDKAVLKTNLSAWQQYGSEKSQNWSDFVSPDLSKAQNDSEVSRQNEIFRLISDEQAYVKRLRILETKILYNARRELYDTRNSEDGLLLKHIETIGGIIADISRFHCQLLENLYCVQREQYPFITSFVFKCGVDQVPWSSLYEVRYGTLYQELASLIQENKVRLEASQTLNRIALKETGDASMDFMTCLRTPCKYLRDLASRIHAIFDVTSEESDDKTVLSEMWPMLMDVCLKTEEMTSASREKARLSRLAGALNFSKYPGLKDDTDLSSNGRSLYVSGQLRVKIKQGRDETLNEYYCVLLDNYLLLAHYVSEQGIVRLDVSEKPMPLDLISYGVDDSQNAEEEVSCGLLDYSGSPRRTLHLFSDTYTRAKHWSRRLKTAIQERMQDAEAHMVMELGLIRRFKVAPTCSAEFYFEGPVTVIACDSPEAGIYIQREGLEPRRVLALSNISRMSAIAELRMLLVLADKTLYYFRFEELINFNKTPSLHVLDENTNVSFYRVGYLPDRTFLVVLAKKKDKNLIRFYEGSEKSRSPSVLKYRNKRTPFQNLVNIGQPSQIRDICFLQSRLVLVGESFLLVDISSEATIKDSFGQNRTTLPREIDSMMSVFERCRKSNPISIHRFTHRLEKTYILCYSDFAAYLNDNGRLSSKIVEWVSNDARGIAFRPPHMLVIGSAAVEIREIASGKLLQLIPAPRHLHLSWVGRYSEHNPADVGVHLVMGDNAQTGPTRGDPWYPNATNSSQYSLYKLRMR